MCVCVCTGKVTGIRGVFITDCSQSFMVPLWTIHYWRRFLMLVPAWTRIWSRFRTQFTALKLCWIRLLRFLTLLWWITSWTWSRAQHSILYARYALSRVLRRPLLEFFFFLKLAFYDTNPQTQFYEQCPALCQICKVTKAESYCCSNTFASETQVVNKLCHVGNLHLYTPSITNTVKRFSHAENHGRKNCFFWSSWQDSHYSWIQK